MNRVIHFEIHADNPERAMAFYRDTFGWESMPFASPVPYWLIKTGPEDQPGIDGGILPRQSPVDGEGVIAYVCTIDVDDVVAMSEKAVAHGAEIVVPKKVIPGVGSYLYCKDTEGNIFGMMQRAEATG
jgi:predicted enzyme related to lactoylglutathione lyase